MDKVAIMHRLAQIEVKRELADSLIMMIKNMPEATLCKMLTNEQQRYMIVGKILKIVLGLGMTIVLKKCSKRIA